MKPCSSCGAEKECSRHVMSDEQPLQTDFFTADDVFIKQIVIQKSGTLVPQHSHAYEHTTMLAVGSIHAWKDDEDMGVYTAPSSLVIPANTKHKFLSLEDNTILYCIHNVSRTKEVVVLEEHQIVGDPICQ